MCTPKLLIPILFFAFVSNLSLSLPISDSPSSPSLSHSTSSATPLNLQAIQGVRKAHTRKSKQQPSEGETPTSPEESQVSKPEQPKQKEPLPEHTKEEPEKSNASEESPAKQDEENTKPHNGTNPAKVTDENATLDHDSESNSDAPADAPDEQTPLTNQNEPQEAKHQPAEESSSGEDSKPLNGASLGDNEAKENTIDTDKSVLSKVDVTSGLRSAGIMIVVVIAIAGGYFVGKTTGLCGGGAIQRYADIRRSGDAEEADGWNDDWGNDDWDEEDEKP